MEYSLEKNAFFELGENKEKNKYQSKQRFHLSIRVKAKLGEFLG